MQNIQIQEKQLTLSIKSTEQQMNQFLVTCGQWMQSLVDSFGSALSHKFVMHCILPLVNSPTLLLLYCKIGSKSEAATEHE